MSLYVENLVCLLYPNLHRHKCRPYMVVIKYVFMREASKKSDEINKPI